MFLMTRMAAAALAAMLICGCKGSDDEPINASGGGGTSTSFLATGSLAAARQGHTATRLASGKVLVTGGWNISGRLDSAELYDPATGGFTPLAGKMSSARYGHTATLLANGKVLLVGGQNAADACLATAELFDPATNGFTPVGALVTARTNHSATLLGDGRVLVAGGWNGSTLSSAERFDPSTGLFTPVGSLVYARRHHTATLMRGGEVLLAGGDNALGPMASTEVYQPGLGVFIEGFGMIASRTGHSAVPIGDAVLVLGGWIGSGSQLTASTEYLSIITSSLAGAPLGTPRGYASATVLVNGKVLVVGGYGPLASAELRDPTYGSFSPTGGLTVARSQAPAVLLNDGRVLVVGGSGASGALASAEIYQP